MEVQAYKAELKTMNVTNYIFNAILVKYIYTLFKY